MEIEGVFFQFEIIMLYVNCHFKYFHFFSAETVFIRQNLTSTDVRFWHIKTVPALKGLRKNVLSKDYLPNTSIIDGALLTRVLIFYCRGNIPCEPYTVTQPCHFVFHIQVINEIFLEEIDISDKKNILLLISVYSLLIFLTMSALPALAGSLCRILLGD